MQLYYGLISCLNDFILNIPRSHPKHQMGESAICRPLESSAVVVSGLRCPGPTAWHRCTCTLLQPIPWASTGCPQSRRRQWLGSLWRCWFASCSGPLALPKAHVTLPGLPASAVPLVPVPASLCSSPGLSHVLEGDPLHLPVV